ncbi:MAG TPA: hypothetical protein VNG69_12855 [Casimicrobiaceae bacterium]|nr:hypothetical protein [Casimicrobiaceae bacterium]
MTIERSRLRALIWNGLTGAIPRISLLIAGLYVAQRFGADAFARYSLVIATVAVAGSLPATSLTTAASKFVAEFEHERAGSAAIGLLSIIMALVVASLVWAIAPWLAQVFAVEPPITTMLRVAALTIGATIVSGGLIGVLVGAGRFRASALAQLAGFVVFVAALVPLGRALDATGAVIALGLHYAITVVFAVIAARRMLRANGSPQFARRMRRVLGFLVPVMISSGLITLVVWLVNAIIARGPNPLVEVSRFNAAYSWFAVVSFAPAVLAQVEFVRLSRTKAAGGVATLSDEMRRFTLRNAQLMAILCVAIAVFASPAMGLYRAEGVEAERTLQLLMAAAFMQAIGNPAGLFLAVIDRIWLASALNFAWGMMTLAACWLLRDAGAVGATTAFLVAYAIHFAVATLVARRLVARNHR